MRHKILCARCGDGGAHVVDEEYGVICAACSLTLVVERKVPEPTGPTSGEAL